MIEVKENDNGSFDISWDPKDPKESMLNEWTEQDFVNAIVDQCNKILDEYKEVTNLGDV